MVWHASRVQVYRKHDGSYAVVRRPMGGFTAPLGGLYDWEGERAVLDSIMRCGRVDCDLQDGWGFAGREPWPRRIQNAELAYWAHFDRGLQHDRAQTQAWKSRATETQRALQEEVKRVAREIAQRKERQRIADIEWERADPNKRREYRRHMRWNYNEYQAARDVKKRAREERLRAQRQEKQRLAEQKRLEQEATCAVVERVRLEEQLALQKIECQKQIDEAISQGHYVSGMTPDEYRLAFTNEVLHLVHKLPGLSISQLANMLKAPVWHVERALDTLARAGRIQIGEAA